MMGWDNRVFNVNGRGLKMLTQAIELVTSSGQAKRGFTNSPEEFAHDPTRITGSIVSKESGLVWLWSEVPGCTKYPVALTNEQVAQISAAWLDTEEARSMKFEDCDADADHDGDNSRGWRVYVREWGHIDDIGWQAVCAVRPTFLWHGK